jgi:Methyltransferase domain
MTPNANEIRSSTCCVCGATTAFAFSARIMGARFVSYFRCSGCGIIATEPPTWLSEAYEHALADIDTGEVDRAARVCRRVVALSLLLRLKGRAVDYGGGHGLLVRMLRDSGLDFYWMDPHAENVFARGFEAVPGEYELLSLIEVMEHVPEPVPFLRDLINRYRPTFLFFTTELHEPEETPPQTWFYYGFESGQHVCLHTHRSLGRLAELLQCYLVSMGPYHLLSRIPVSRRLFSAACSRWSLLSRPIATRLRGTKITSDSALLATRNR